MANNIDIIDATATVQTIATTDVGGVHYQNVYILGDVAHDAVDSGNPLKVGGYANSSLPTAVAVGDRVNGLFDTRGRFWIFSGTTATDLGKAEDAAHTTGDTGVMALSVRTDTRASSAGTTADYAALATDASGSLWVNPGATAMAALADATTNPTAALVGVCLEGYNGSTWDRLRSDTTNGLDVDVTRVIPGTTATALGKAEDAAHTTGDTGVMALAVRQDTLSALATTTGDYIPLSTDANGALYCTLATVASMGGPDTQFDSDGDNTAQQCKASAGILCGIHVQNSNGSAAFIQFFDLATGSVTVGSTTPKMSFQVPANGNLDIEFIRPIPFATAITYACTTTATGSGDPATGLTVTNLYK